MSDVTLFITEAGASAPRPLRPEDLRAAATARASSFGEPLHDTGGTLAPPAGIRWNEFFIFNRSESAPVLVSIVTPSGVENTEIAPGGEHETRGDISRVEIESVPVLWSAKGEAA